MNKNMMNSDSLEDRLDATRVKLYEQTKSMTPQEHVDFINQKSKEILAKHGVKTRLISAPSYPKIRVQS